MHSVGRAVVGQRHTQVGGLGVKTGKVVGPGPGVQTGGSWHRRGQVWAELWRGEHCAASDSSVAGPRGSRRVLHGS